VDSEWSIHVLLPVLQPSDEPIRVSLEGCLAAGAAAEVHGSALVLQSDGDRGRLFSEAHRADDDVMDLGEIVVGVSAEDLSASVAAEVVIDTGVGGLVVLSRLTRSLTREQPQVGQITDLMLLA
jgi:hypothetical protein